MSEYRPELNPVNAFSRASYPFGFVTLSWLFCLKLRVADGMAKQSAAMPAPEKAGLVPPSAADSDGMNY
jgi:hypothetical protein